MRSKDGNRRQKQKRSTDSASPQVGSSDQPSTAPTADRAPRKREGLGIGVTAALALMLLAAHNLLGPLVLFQKTALMVSAGLYCFAVVAFRHLRLSQREGRLNAALAFGLLTAFVTVVLTCQGAFALGMAVLVLLAALRMCARQCEVAPFVAVGCCTFLGSVFLLMVDVPQGQLWMYLQEGARRFCSVFAPRISFNATAALLRVTIYACFLACSYALVTRSLKAAINAVSLSLAAWLANGVYLFICGMLPSRLWHVGLGPSAHDSNARLVTSFVGALSMYDAAVLYAVLLVLPIVFLMRRSTAATVRLVPMSVGRPALTTFALTVCCVAFVSQWMSTPVPVSDLGGLRIGYYSTWDEGVPQHESKYRYGLAMTGMYGVFVHDLEARGAEVIRLTEKRMQMGLPSDAQPEAGKEEDHGHILLDRAKDLDTIVIMVRTDPMSQEEVAFFDRFVKEGGNVVVIGDHTNLEGCQKPFNQLVEALGMRLEFDSAFSHLHWWYDNITPNPQLGFKESCWLEYGMATGGSLHVSSPAVPLLVARYAFSDHGNILKNSKKDAYLGDYSYQSGELLSDIVLAATARHGKGRVVAFGDSSMFQNIAYSRSGTFVRHLLTWSAGRSPSVAARFPELCALALLLASPLCLVIPHFVGVAGQVTLSAAAFAAVVALPLGGATTNEGRPSEKRCALIDRGDSQINRDMFGARSYLGVPLNMARGGYSSQWIPTITRERLDDSECAMLFAPTKRLSRSECRVLDEYMRRGGTLFLTAGNDLNNSVRRFLSRYGIQITDTPLGGSVFEHKDGVTPTFINAWEVRCGTSSDVLHKLLKRPVIVHHPVGKGGLVLIADSQFLCDENLEEEKKARFANVVFFKLLLERIEQRNFGEITIEDLERCQATMFEKDTPADDAVASAP